MVKFIKTNFFMLLATLISILVFIDQSFIIQKIDPKAEPFFNEFVSYIPDSCKQKAFDYNKIVIEFDTLGLNFIGVCKERFRERKILLDKEFWRTATEEDKKQLAFHEFAHCFLERDHVNDFRNYMFPVQYSMPNSLLLIQLKDDINEFCKDESQ